MIGSADMAALLVVALLQDDVAKLESSDPLEARRAFEALIAAGDEAPLRKVAERCERARHALAEIRAHRRFGAAYPPIRLIRYEADDLPTREVLEEFAEHLGVRLKEGSFVGPMPERISIHLREAYALEALDSVFRAANHGWWEEDGAIVYSIPAWPIPRLHTYYRRFQISIESFYEFRKRDPFGNVEGSAALWIRIKYDTACRPAGSRGVKFTEVIDDKGRSLLPEEARDLPSYAPFQNLSSHVPIKAPSDDVLKLARVRGVFVALFPERPAPGEIPLAGERRALEAPNLTLAVEKVLEGGSRISVTGKIGDLKKAHVRPLPGDFRLKGKDGRTLPAGGAVSGRRESPVAELQFEIPDGFEPVALVVEYFQGMGEHEIPFDFQDVPIR
jgi:hypothetical protein